MEALISVIIPTYNRQELLAQALESVQHQDWPHLEVLVADDGSTDGTRTFLEQLAESPAWKQPGRCLRPLFLEHSGFPGRVRNQALEAARGDWLALLDSDDLWTREKLVRQWQYLQDYRKRVLEAGLCHSRELWLRRGREVKQPTRSQIPEGDIFPAALEKCIIGPSTVLFTRRAWESLGPFREDLEVAEDYELWLRWTWASPVAYLDQAHTIKRAGDWDQLSEKYGQIEIFRIRALEDWLQTLVPAQLETAHGQRAREVLLRKMQIYAQGARKRGREEDYQSWSQRAETWTAVRPQRSEQP